MQNVNPDIQRYWHRDIFSIVASVPAEEHSVEAAKEAEDSLTYLPLPISFDESIELENCLIKLERIDMNPSHPDYERESGDLVVGLQLAITE